MTTATTASTIAPPSGPTLVHVLMPAAAICVDPKQHRTKPAMRNILDWRRRCTPRPGQGREAGRPNLMVALLCYRCYHRVPTDTDAVTPPASAAPSDCEKVFLEGASSGQRC